MPILTDEREYRVMSRRLAPLAAGTARRSAVIGDADCYVEGFATTFNDPYVLWIEPDGSELREQIDRHALDNADMSDIIFQYDHAGRVFARTANGSLEVTAQDDGLFTAADLSRTPLARDLYGDIVAEMITRMSWCFRVPDDGIEYDKQEKLITIKRVDKVYDVSAVSIPANDATEISARNFARGRLDAEAAERLFQRVELLKLRTKL